MDPLACIERLLRETKNVNDSEAIQAAGDLLSWLLAGGSIPYELTPGRRNAIALAMAKLADRAEANELRLTHEQNGFCCARCGGDLARRDGEISDLCERCDDTTLPPRCTPID